MCLAKVQKQWDLSAPDPKERRGYKGFYDVVQFSYNAANLKFMKGQNNASNS